MTHERDEVEELADVMETMDKEERFAMLVGNAFLKAYNHDQSFRNLVAELCRVIRHRKPKKELFWIDDVINNWLLSSYHQAMVAELLFKYAIEYQDDSYQFDGLMRIQHDTADGMIHSIVNCRRMLRDSRYAKTLGGSADDVEQIFEKYFPNLIDVRDALAHEDARVMPSKHLRETSSVGMINNTQHKAQAGNKIWGLKSQNRDTDLSIAFDSKSYVGLVTDLRQLFESK